MSRSTAVSWGLPSTIVCEIVDSIGNSVPSARARDFHVGGHGARLAAGAHEPVHVQGMRLARPLGHQARQGLAQHLGLGHAEHALGGGVEQQDVVGGVHRHDGVHDRIDGLVVAVVGVAQGPRQLGLPLHGANEERCRRDDENADQRGADHHHDRVLTPLGQRQVFVVGHAHQQRETRAARQGEGVAVAVPGGMVEDPDLVAGRQQRPVAQFGGIFADEVLAVRQAGHQRAVRQVK
jgi:hypothetical protein